MAAFNYDDYGESQFGGTLTAALNWAGAFLSVVLIAGLATWGWKLWVRDVSGVPVVRALEGPMRVTPEEPGGLASEYQGLSVNRIAEERVEDSMADRVVLAPQPSVLNEEEDLAMADLQPFVEPEPLPGTEVVPSQEVMDGPATVEVAEAPEFVAAESDTAAVIEAEPEQSGTVPVVTPRPAIRPENLQAVSYRPATDGGANEIDPATIPSGTRLVQLGAFGSQEIARAEWEKTMAQFGNYMAGKERVIQEAETGGRTFWRLRAMGFEDLADARRFCSVLVSDGANCIPVVQE